MYILWESESHIVGILAIELVVVDFVLCDRSRKLEDQRWRSRDSFQGDVPRVAKASKRISSSDDHLPFPNLQFQVPFCECSEPCLVEHRRNGHTALNALAVTIR